MRSGESITADSASALARKKRVRWNSLVPSAEKKTKRSTPACSAARSSRAVASPFNSSTFAAGWSRIAAARWITVPHAAQRLAANPRIAQLGEIAEGDAHVDAMAAEAARVAHQGAQRLAASRAAAVGAPYRPSPWLR